jgi:hypothetical protein
MEQSAGGHGGHALERRSLAMAMALGLRACHGMAKAVTAVAGPKEERSSEDSGGSELGLAVHGRRAPSLAVGGQRGSC